jgi:ankyrin repeat protein
MSSAELVKPIVVEPDDANAQEADEQEKQSKPNPEADESLREASFEGRINAVRAALNDGADVSAVGENGRTALMLAAYGGHHKIVELLLDLGADVNQRAPDGFTALIFAASGPSPATVELLLNHDAEVDVREQGEQFTALMYAASEGEIENVKLLLRYGANPSLKDVDGDTAADFAQHKGHGEIVRLLRQGPQKE